MENIVSILSKRFLEKEYPELKIIFEDDYIIAWEGRFYVNVEYGGFNYNKAPKLGIEFFKNYPNQIPKIYDLENSFKKYSHVFLGEFQKSEVPEFKSKDRLCLATGFDMDLQLSNSKSIEDFIEKFLLPYFISFESYRQTGRFVFGDRAHYAVGYYQSLADYFKVKGNNDYLLKNLLIWASKSKRFKKIFPIIDRHKVQNRFSQKIGRLRKMVTIPKLKSHLKKLIDLEEKEKNLQELLKRQNSRL